MTVMRIHRSSCCYNYDTSAEVCEVEEIVGVFGEKKARWFLVKWAGCEEPEWERGHLLERDGCQEAIHCFWSTSGLNPNQNYYPDPDGRR